MSTRHPRNQPPRAARPAPRRKTSSSRRYTWLYGAGGLLALAGLAWVVFHGFGSPSPPAADGRSQPTGMQAEMVGMPAPSIPLPATTGGQFTLDQYRGHKVVLYFYEGAG